MGVGGEEEGRGVKREGSVGGGAGRGWEGRGMPCPHKVKLRTFEGITESPRTSSHTMTNSDHMYEGTLIV